MKIFKTIAASILVLAGLAVGAAGGLLFGLFGSDGTVASGSHPISTSRSALVSSVTDVSDISDVADLVGEPRVRLSARAGRPVFVGIGPAAQVRRYLASAPVDEVTDFEVDPFRLERRPRGGSARPEPPAGQGFWVAKATGRAPTLRWKVRDGDYRLVLMNADGSRGVHVNGDVGVTLPHISRWASGLVVGGALLLVGGMAVATVTFRSRRSVRR
jgi:hypothetical protein